MLKKCVQFFWLTNRFGLIHGLIADLYAHGFARKAVAPLTAFQPIQFAIIFCCALRFALTFIFATTLAGFVHRFGQQLDDYFIFAMTVGYVAGLADALFGQTAFCIDVFIDFSDVVVHGVGGIAGRCRDLLHFDGVEHFAHAAVRWTGHFGHWRTFYIIAGMRQEFAC